MRYLQEKSVRAALFRIQSQEDDVGVQAGITMRDLRCEILVMNRMV
jgi:hypothetical protein